MRQPPRRVLPGPATAARLQRAHRLEQGRAELAVDGHRLAGGLHLHAQRPIRLGKLVERPARQLDHDIVDRRFEGGRADSRGGVRQLVQPLPRAHQCGQPRDGVTGGLGGQRAGAADPWVDLDDAVVGAVGRHGQLDVAAALQAQGAHDLQGAAAQSLDHGVRQGLDRRHHDRVAGVYAHRIKVLHAADGDGRVGGVPQHLELDLVPAQQRALHQHLVDGAGRQAVRDPLPGLDLVEGESASPAAKGECRPNHNGRIEMAHEREPVVHGLHHCALRHGLTDAGHQRAEAAAILGRSHRREGRAQHPHAVPLQDAGVIQRHGEVQPGLAAERGQQGIRSVLGDHPLQVSER